MTHQLFHLREAAAFTLNATTMAERLGSVFVAVIMFVVSLDIVLLHWIFQLHRITSGPEADVLEPLFVLCGIALTIIGVKRELGAGRRHA